MSVISQLALPQSTTREAKTAPSTTVATKLSTMATTQEHKQRLDLYNSLFGHGTNKPCDKTGLQLTSSLNYSLQTFLYTSDINWVLAIIGIDGLDEMNEKYGTKDAKIRKIHQIGTVIKDFCANDPRKLKGFRYDDLIDHGNSDDIEHSNEEESKDLFAILLYCHPKLNKSEKYISKLIKKIKLLTNETVSIGIAKMNEWETFEEWKQRAFKNVENARNIATQTDNNSFYSDVDVKYVNPKHVEEQDEKKQQASGRVVNKMGNSQEFDKKMQEISNHEEYHWIAAIMVIDDFDSFLFANRKEVAIKEIDKMEKEMYHLFDIYGNGTNKNEMKYFGYKFNDKRGKYGIILYDSKDTSKCFVPAHEILETLKEEISMKCVFTVSIGSSRLIEDDLGMTDDWIERMSGNVTRAKSAGGNQVCFGSGNENDDENDNSFESKMKDVIIGGDGPSDAIETKSLQEIEKYGFAAAVDLENVKIVANSGNLVNENEIDVRCDFDPTTAFALNCITDVTYKQIFYETTQFITDNTATRPYLWYPKMYLNSNPPKCGENKHCKQCCNTNDTNNTNCISTVPAMFSLCQTKRRQLGHKLFEFGQIRNCMTDSLSKTARQLLVPDNVLLKDSNEYKLKDNWFVKVYSHVKWHQETTTALLENLVKSASNEIENEYDDESKREKDQMSDRFNNLDKKEEKDVELDQLVFKRSDITGGDDLDCAIATVKDVETIFLYRFDLLTLLHSYLDKLSEYLVLYYTCFDSKLWIAVFYHFIEIAIGTSQCDSLFAESSKSSMAKRDVTSLCGLMLEVSTDVENGFDYDKYNNKKNIIAKEMKGISIFQNLLCEVYSNDIDVSDANVMFDPFDLALNISVKLSETVSNIKTQWMIYKMTGFTSTLCRSGNGDMNTDAVNSSEKLISDEFEERKDDWVIDEIDINKDNYNHNLLVPSFIRLFVIRRIISKHLVDVETSKTKQKIKSDDSTVDSNVNHNTKTANIVPSDKTEIQDLVSVFDDNTEIKSIANDILTRLINDGIELYMEKWYNEKQQAYIIEMIFNRIILVYFGKEYDDLTNYKHNDIKLTNNSKHQQMVFNSQDLMCEIFQYLEWGSRFDQDLFECSLVNSCWLYHSWNVNSVYHISLNELIKQKSEQSIRTWQRLIHAKSIYISAWTSNIRDWSHILSKLVLVRTIDKVFIKKRVAIDIAKTIMSVCKERIKYCDIHVDQIHSMEAFLDQEVTGPPENVLSPLKLLNAKCIRIRDVCFYRIWSNKCSELELCKIENVSEDWVKFVIKNCDCSGIEILTLNNILIKHMKEPLLQQLALLFVNIQQLSISIDLEIVPIGYENIVSFWQFLKPIISKNNGRVELNIPGRRLWHNYEYDDIIHQDLKIEKLIVDMNKSSGGSEDAIKFIKNRETHLHHLVVSELKSSHIQYDCEFERQLTNQLSFESIAVLELKDFLLNENDLNDWLSLHTSAIGNKQLFVIFEGKTDNSTLIRQTDFLASFKLICKNIRKWIEIQNPFDVKILFENTNEAIFKACLSVYKSHFQSKTFLDKYDEPKCNKLFCSPRIKPFTYLVKQSSTRHWHLTFVLKATNVEHA